MKKTTFVFLSSFLAISISSVNAQETTSATQPGEQKQNVKIARATKPTIQSLHCAYDHSSGDGDTNEISIVRGDDEKYSVTYKHISNGMLPEPPVSITLTGLDCTFDKTDATLFECKKEYKLATGKRVDERVFSSIQSLTTHTKDLGTWTQESFVIELIWPRADQPEGDTGITNIHSEKMYLFNRKNVCNIQ